ncbi:MAG: class I SAM-dependent methyltransferase [Candidatus Thiodiazotropha sp. (ex Lucinoma borealis)]|nr:class I SAM-dependent methyltransferase [Candidatus Thiodiazotropha sp. (ex Lucinoma borealis)]
MKEYASLQTQLDLSQGIPYTPDWSAGADFIQIIVDACLQFKPSLILECSSGLTTLMLARCCQMNGRGRVASLEDGEQYADKTRDYIDRYGLSEYASVIHAPLQKIPLHGVEYDWYINDAIPDESIDMLVIDGPSGFIQKNARYPALPILYPKLSNCCSIYLDDAARPDEQAIVALWQYRYPNLRHEYRETSRGCSILMV